MLPGGLQSCRVIRPRQEIQTPNPVAPAPIINWDCLFRTQCVAANAGDTTVKKLGIPRQQLTGNRFRRVSCLHLVTGGDFLTDRVGGTFHHPEMHPGQILSYDAQSQELGA